MNTTHDDMFVNDTDPAIDAVIDAAGAAGDASELAADLAATLGLLQRSLEQGDVTERPRLEAEALDAIEALRRYAVGALIIGGAE